jgi:uncharacterized protein (TIGR03437 family)
VVSAAAPTAERVTVTLGEVAVEVLWSGKIAPGLYQINLRLPQSLHGEQALVLTVGGYASPSGPVLTMQ